jgi:phage tail sheath protein FI
MKQNKISLSVEIETGLKKIMDQYRNQPNTEETWTSIRSEAENFLYTYYRKKKLIGNQPKEAYFIKIGLQTMTASDIQANKKILIAGFSEYKPAEFMILTIETIPLNKTGKL